MQKLTTKRKFLRVSPERDNPVKVSLIGADFMHEFKVVDISRGGVGILASTEFDGCNLHENVELALSLPYPKRILVKATGRVVHHQGARFGIAFSDVPEKSEKVLRMYIAKRIENETLTKRLAFRFGFI